MNYVFSLENQRYIQQVIKRGEFDNQSDVLNEALRLMKERERRIANLREEVQEGMCSGPGILGKVVLTELEEQAEKLAQTDRAKR